MTSIQQAGAYSLGDLTVNRLGYGAMQLAGPHVFGPPKDKAQALAVLREALELGINHIDTSDFYGPHITNQLIREALHPYRDDLVIVTKVGARRGDDASWLLANSPPNSNRPCTTTCATWAWTCWTWSTCASCSTWPAPPKATSNRPSPPSPNCSARA